MKAQIIVVDAELGAGIAEALCARGIAALGLSTVAEGRVALEHGRPRVLVLDPVLPDGDGLELLRDHRRRDLEARCLLLLRGRQPDAFMVVPGHQAVIRKPATIEAILARIVELEHEFVEAAHGGIDAEAIDFLGGLPTAQAIDRPAPTGPLATIPGAATAAPMRRRRTRMVSTVAVLGLALGALATLSFVRDVRTAVCDPGDPLAELWGEPRKSTIASSIEGLEGPWIAESWARIAPRLDQYAARLAELQREACAAVPEQVDRELGCLHARVQAFRTLVEVLGEGDIQVWSNAIDAAFRLEEELQCAAPANLADGERGDALRTRLAEIQMLINVGRYERAKALALAAQEEADQLGGELQAEARFFLGKAHETSWEFAAAEAAYASAIEVAASAHANAFESRAWIGMMFVVGERLRRPEQAAGWVPAAEAAVQRAGDPPPLRANFEGCLGVLALARDEFDRAERHFRDAIESAKVGFGEGHPWVAMYQRDLGITIARGKRLVDARTELTHARASAEVALGPSHPELASYHEALGTLAYKMEDFTTSLAEHRDALALRRATLDDLHPQVANAWFALGRVQRKLELDEDARTSFAAAIFALRSNSDSDPKRLALAYNSLGELLVRKRDMIEATKNFRAALEIAQHTSDKGLASATLKKLCRAAEGGEVPPPTEVDCATFKQPPQEQP